MQIGVVGVNHKSCPLDMREQLKKAFEEIFDYSSYKIEAPYVMLSTCNRTELYIASRDLAEAHVEILKLLRTKIFFHFEHWLYSYFESECFTHLASVTAGLDSLIVGESEIQHQVKIAYESARKRTFLSSSLHYLFQKCLKIGKHVRTTCSLYQRSINLSSIIMDEVEFFRVSHSLPKVLFVGNSETNRKLIKIFHSKHIKDLTLCSRSKVECVDKLSLQWIAREHLSRWDRYDIIICATQADDYLLYPLRKPLLKRCLLLDLGVPRHVDPSVARDSCVTLLNLEDLGSKFEMKRQEMNQHLEKSEHVLKAAALHYSYLFKMKQAKIAPLTSSKELVSA